MKLSSWWAWDTSTSPIDDDVVGEGEAPVAVGRVDAAGRRRDGEQLRADALVDVPVQVDGDELEVVAVSGRDGHGGDGSR